MAGSRVAMAVATAPIRPLAWKPPNAVGVVLKKQKDQKKKIQQQQQQQQQKAFLFHVHKK